MDDKGAAPPVQRFVIQVNPGRPRFGVDLTLCKKDWVPDARNKKIEFTARIYAFKGGKWEYPGESRRIRFSFIDDSGKKAVSKEWGVCMNYPIRDKNNVTPAAAIESNQNPDLFFDEDDPQMNAFDLEEDDTSGDPCPTEILAANDNPVHQHHYLKATTKDAVTEATVVVRCEDYGAFGILRAEAEDCETLKPRESDKECSGETGPNDVKIPRDDNGNFIADGAAQDKLKDGTKAPEDGDEDDVPHSTDHTGDGLTNYEEYRGFIVKVGSDKRHIRTDINNKDVFIFDRDNIKTGYFNASGLTIHFLDGPAFYNGNASADEDKPPTPSDRQLINCNRTSYSGGEQHCLRLYNVHHAGTTLGYTYGGNVPLLPKDVNYVSVDRAKLAALVAGRLDKTIAHELGHSVHVVHHGDPDPAQCPTCNYTVSGGVTSGNVSCIMRYGPNYDTKWCHQYNGACHNHNVPANEAVASTFCDKPDATGCNIAGAPCNFKNNATVGNCKNQIRVKDW
jgi:hypothetical protein